jgi:hypothetical protein
MGSLRFTDLQTRPTEVVDLTSLTLNEFRQLGRFCRNFYLRRFAV